MPYNQSHFEILERDGNILMVGPPDQVQSRFSADTDTIRPATTCRSCGTAYSDDFDSMTCPCLDC